MSTGDICPKCHKYWNQSKDIHGTHICNMAKVGENSLEINEPMKRFNYKNIDTTTPEGRALKTAIVVLCQLRFPDKKPELVLRLVMDIREFVWVDETLTATMERVEANYNAEN